MEARTRPENKLIVRFANKLGRGSLYSRLTGGELVSQSLVDLGFLLPLCVLLGGGLGPLLVEDGLLGVSELGALLTAQRQSVVRLVPAQNIGDLGN